MTRGWLPQRTGLPCLNGGGTAAAVPRIWSWSGVGINAPPDTMQVIAEAIFTASHLTDTDKNTTGK